MPIEKVEKVWMDGELVDWDRATVHVLTHTLHYGSGVFEGIRCYETKRGPAIFRLRDHIARLYRSAAIYMIDIPYAPEELIEAAKATVRVNGLRECYVRPIVYLGYGEMGLNPLPAPVNVAIAVWHWGAYLGEECIDHGCRAKISSWVRHDPNIIPAAAKGIGQYVNSSLAKIEAIKAGYDEAIMLNPHGYVAEGTGENIFIVRDGAVVTPPLSAGPLGGLTRDSAMTIARDRGYDVIEADLMRTDLYTADEAFFTGTAAEITPIREIDDRTIGSGDRGPITKELQETFFGAIRGEIPEYDRWLDHVG
ncbi:MAG TPA: branched-chain-amino-acid transaminase [Actinomycetota bacterium]|nr:branched-chain-amino-acid transaminase [Actinomycetota bacterium]